MRTLIDFLFFILVIYLVGCSENSPFDPSQDQNTKGTLVVKSVPPGARIYLLGTDTGKNTPDTLRNLEAGDYNLFLYLQYYDTAYFTATISKNLVTTKEITLLDALPMVDIILDYSTAFNGDSVKFFYTLNQDVLLDSVTVERPLNTSGSYEKNKYAFGGLFFPSYDRSGNPVKYYLPPSGSGIQYYIGIQHKTYWFNFFGHKAYGAKSFFYISINYIIN